MRALLGASLVMVIVIPVEARADRCADLLQSLDGVKPAEQVAIVRQLGHLGRDAAAAVEVLENLLYAYDLELANQAARSLAQIGTPAVAVLRRGCHSEDLNVCLRSTAALALVGPLAKPAVPDLVRALSHPHEMVRATALLALGEIGPAAGEAGPEIVKCLRSRSFVVRSHAVVALGKIGTVVVPELGRLVKDEEADVRADAALALSLYGPLAKPALPELEGALKDDNAEVRASAALALHSLEKEAKETLPKLIALLHDTDYEVQVNSFAAALAVGADDPRLMRGLREANRKGKWATPFILKQFGQNPADAVPHLVKNLQDKDPTVRIGAAWGLGQLGLPARPAIPALQKVLKDPQPQTRLLAFVALKQINQEIFEEQHPMFKEWVLGMRRQAEQLQERQRAIAETTPKMRFQMAASNPFIQGYYDKLTHLHVHLSLTKQSDPTVDTLLRKAGPEAIPALVRTVNHVATLNAGFT